tara:strand:+ start:8801 stop:10558 length:1758 start_codon:yes stop_codon:yes gene_type:complete
MKSQKRKSVFSLPINPKIDSKYAETVFVPWLKRYKDYIYDLYFTCRMPPFTQDSMGDVFQGDVRQLYYNAKAISEDAGNIPLSATFNNIYVRPDIEQLDLFVKNFGQLYDLGVKTVTLPHTSWLSTGIIQKEFPELKIKNTILRNVTKPNEIVALAKVGFHYINLDRDLMRDREALKKIKKAKEYCAEIGKPVELSLLANEGCWGGCSMMDEHYHFNNTRTEQTPQYFNDPISTHSCSLWDIEDNSHALKAANLPPWREDWEEFLDLGIDVFKMHGRENGMKLMESMQMIEAWASEHELVTGDFKEYMEDLKIPDSPIALWREKIKTCGFECWDCNYCEAVVDAHLKKQGRPTTVDDYTQRVLKAIDDGNTQTSNFEPEGYSIPGLSSNRIRHFLNSLCSHDDAVYLELGTYTGSTFFAATMNNKAKCIGVDDFSEPNVKPIVDRGMWTECGNPYDTFVNNWQKYENGNAAFVKASVEELTEEDFGGSKVNILFYDANHDMMVQMNNLNHLLPFLDEKFILIVDDANFDGVVEGAVSWAQENNLKCYLERKILSSVIESPVHWWNGIHVMVLEKDDTVKQYISGN